MIKRIPQITELRGIFMIMIFLYHIHLFEGGGTLGVAFFFVLSGFSLTIGYRERIMEGSFSYHSFLKRRVVKMVPLHWLMLVAAAILHFRSFFETLPQLFANLLLVQSWIPIESFYLSFNSVSWYLSDTFFLVGIFPFIIRYVTKVSWLCQFLVAFIVFSSYIALLVFLPINFYSPVLYISPLVRMMDFVVGIYLAFFIIEYVDRPHPHLFKFLNNNYFIAILILLSIIVLLVIVSQILDFPHKKFSVFYWPFICLLIAFAAIMGLFGYGGGKRGLMYWFGEISFTFFMSHQVSIRYSSAFFESFFPSLSIWVQNVLFFFISACVAYFLDRFFVKPISKLVLRESK